MRMEAGMVMLRVCSVRRIQLTSAGYKMTELDLTPWYKELVESESLRILIYYGDTDTSVNYIGGEEWTTSLGVPEVEEWRPWTTDNATEMVLLYSVAFLSAYFV